MRTSSALPTFPSPLTFGPLNVPHLPHLPHTQTKSTGGCFPSTRKPHPTPRARPLTDSHSRMSSAASPPEPSAAVERCFWVPLTKPHYVRYHDDEWGVPPRDDRKHFELLCLEGAQAGLSWETVLRKREGYRAAFHAFDPRACAEMSDGYLESVVRGERGDVVKHKGKVASVRSNAVAFLEVVAEFGSWDAFLRTFFQDEDLAVSYETKAQYPTQTPGSQRLAKDLKRRGFKFLGPTIAYAYMQAAGVVTDHQTSCFRFAHCLEAHRSWREAS